MNHQIYDVTQELTKDGRQVTSDFWTSEVDGVLPYEALAEQTIEQLKHNRAIYENAKELGYVSEIDYEHLLERLETENETRAKKIAEGEPVYGLSSFTTELFWEYETDSFQKEYCNNLENEGMEITDAEREAYYEEYKDALFVKYDDITLDYVKIDYTSAGMTEEQTKEYKDSLIEVFKQVDEENSLESIVSQDERLSGYFEHAELYSGEISAASRMYSDILEYGYELSAGEMTQVIDDYGCLYLIQCTDKVDYDYLPMDEVKDNINKELRERHYDQLIEQRAADAVVDGDMNKVYAFTKKHIKK